MTIISDPQRESFSAHGVEAGGIINYLHPAGLIAAIRAMSRGFRHGKFEGEGDTTSCRICHDGG